MKDLLLYLVSNIAQNPKDVEIRDEENDAEITFHITCAPEDTGRIIGKKGKIIKALRRVLSILALKEGKRVNIAMVSAPPSEEDESEQISE